MNMPHSSPKTKHNIFLQFLNLAAFEIIIALKDISQNIHLLNQKISKILIYKINFLKIVSLK